jgi:hypothetical protein
VVLAAIALALLALWMFSTRARTTSGSSHSFDGASTDGLTGSELWDEDDGGRRHRRRDGGASGPDAGVLPEHHEILPEIADPQLPGPEADPEGTDPGPGEEYIERYGGRSGRLSPHARPHGTRSAMPVRSHMAPPNVMAFVASSIALPDVPVVVHAMIRGAHDEDVRPDTLDVSFYRVDPSDGVTVPMVWANDEWQYAYLPTREAHPAGDDGAPPRVSFLVRATGTYEGEAYSRSCTGWFYMHTPGARLATDRASVERRASDVVMTVPVVIERAGAYFGYAELWGGEGQTTPVAFGRERVVFEEAGEQTFTFLFGGAVIRDSGVDGPYLVRNVRFMQVDSIPPQEQPPVEEMTPTPEWHASDFH